LAGSLAVGSSIEEDRTTRYATGIATSIHEKIGDAITLFRNGIKPFVERELQSYYGDDWKKMVGETLRFDPGED